ncbi:hypothetical protein KIN20_006341 [Parelaphostrongylus tenuis]|uniref:Uncharacterized protein n=1 Tax=Parelaphostrongylus tenuis TaxID=148309 RepID=A0AAD5MMH5_PARTN|nr:hypothetical protein KIN20_006341 [Parelaphostrongylus tenuis]
MLTTRVDRRAAFKKLENRGKPLDNLLPTQAQAVSKALERHHDVSLTKAFADFVDCDDKTNFGLSKTSPGQMKYSKCGLLGV